MNEPTEKYLARKRGKPEREASETGSRWGETGLASLRSIGALLALSLLIGAAVYGLERVKEHVFARPEYNPAFRVELAGPPQWVDAEEWHRRILDCVRIPTDQEWLDETLVPLVADQINRSGWVSKLHRVEQGMDGVIRIVAEYRRPIAMVRVKCDVGECFVPVDRHGVRLPEVYRQVSDGLGWMRIVGVESDLPEIGEPFQGDDAVAGIRLAALLFDQDFSSRITGIDVLNFRGRRDKRDNHIKLRTREGGMIAWGSAIGEEIEEPTAQDKLRTIAVYFKKGSPQAQVDISVYRNGWIEPVAVVDPGIRTADGGRVRVR